MRLRALEEEARRGGRRRCTLRVRELAAAFL